MKIRNKKLFGADICNYHHRKKNCLYFKGEFKNYFHLFEQSNKILNCWSIDYYPVFGPKNENGCVEDMVQYYSTMTVYMKQNTKNTYMKIQITN